MSFWTTLTYYRPAAPPIISAGDLAHFVAQFSQLGACKDEGDFHIQLKFGKSIDLDEKPACPLEPVNDVISVLNEIEWDVNENLKTPQQAAEVLNGHAESTIYRAALVLGAPPQKVTDHLHRAASTENQGELSLFSWALEIGPVEIASLASSERYFVGWMEMALSGPGYLYPWTFRHLIQLAEECPEIRRMEELCRSTWPVGIVSPTKRLIELRKGMGDLWPYELDRPSDWFWGLAEG